ncbi:hypothetical protein [Trebonia kvetii]|uniref:hypothetical protein n=1 Tax=Trebonia kvetii TaxID=2480626 RepID=UPI001C9E421C|nr:hypothetical protein [Trebonia kvetii]
MDLAVRTVATTGQVWAIVIVSVLVTAFLVAATAVAYSWQNRYHRRLRAAGLWQMATAPVIGPGPTVDAPGIVSTAAGRMGPDGPQIADTLAARAAVAPMEETAAGEVYVPAQRLREAAPMPVSEEDLAAEGQGEVPTRVDLPAQRSVREDEQAQPMQSRPGSTGADDPGRV